MISLMWISKPGIVTHIDRSQNSGYFGVTGLRWGYLNADWVGYKRVLKSVGNILYLDLGRSHMRLHTAPYT